jgi:hypothetical protein
VCFGCVVFWGRCAGRAFHAAVAQVALSKWFGLITALKKFDPEWSLGAYILDVVSLEFNLWQPSEDPGMLFTLVQTSVLGT